MLPAITSLAPNAGRRLVGTRDDQRFRVRAWGDREVFDARVVAGDDVRVGYAVDGGRAGACCGDRGCARDDAGGTSAANTGDLYAFGAPAITGLAPNAGTTRGGNTVTINGSGFVPGADREVLERGSSLATTFVSGTQLNVVAPAHAAATVNVLVTTPGGTSAATTGDLYAFGAPAITSVSPNAGPTGGGNTVTINGSGFVPRGAGEVLERGLVAGDDVRVGYAVECGRAGACCGNRERVRDDARRD